MKLYHLFIIYILLTLTCYVGFCDAQPKTKKKEKIKKKKEKRKEKN